MKNPKKCFRICIHPHHTNEQNPITPKEMSRLVDSVKSIFDCQSQHFLEYTIEDNCLIFKEDPTTVIPILNSQLYRHGYVAKEVCSLC